MNLKFLLKGKFSRINDLTHDIKELVIKCDGISVT